MVDLNKIDDRSLYHVLDMLRIPTHLYRTVTRLCEVIVSHGSSQEGDNPNPQENPDNSTGPAESSTQRGIHRILRGQEAVAEVILHASMYMSTTSSGQSVLISDEVEQVMENEVQMMGRVKSRFQIGKTSLFNLYQTN